MSKVQFPAVTHKTSGTNPAKPTMRVAIRTEGDSINAYCAKPDSMDGAILIGSISTVIAQHHPEAFDAFKQFAVKALTHMVATMGVKVVGTFDMQPPAHEVQP